MAKINNIPKEDIEKATPETMVKPVKKKNPNRKGKVANCGLLNVRKEANTTCEVVKCLSVGDTVEILGEEGDFYKIVGGFVMKSYVEI